MPRPYSNDLRARVIEAIEAGASCREVAERYELSASVVVLWAQRFEQTGSVAAKPSGGSTSPLEEHADFLLTLPRGRPNRCCRNAHRPDKSQVQTGYSTTSFRAGQLTAVDRRMVEKIVVASRRIGGTFQAN